MAGEAEETDEELVRRARAGEDAAVAALVERYERPLYGYLRRIVGSDEDAEAVFRESFERVQRHLGRVATKPGFRARLYKTATHLCWSRLRWRWRRYVERVQPEAATAQAAPEAVRLEEAVAKLPLKQRSVFLMARQSGLSYEEIAHALEIPLDTVKSRMNAAVKFLMHRIQDR